MTEQSPPLESVIAKVSALKKESQVEVEIQEKQVHAYRSRLASSEQSMRAALAEVAVYTELLDWLTAARTDEKEHTDD